MVRARGTSGIGSHVGAFRIAGDGLVRAGLVVVDVELGVLVGIGELGEVLEGGGDALGPAGAVEPGAEVLAGLALVVEAPDDADSGVGGGLGRQPQRLLAEVDALLADVPPSMSW